jgi:hypothetical protein
MMQGTVARVCLRVLGFATAEFSYSSTVGSHAPPTPERLNAWMHSLQHMVALDKEVPWLDLMLPSDEQSSEGYLSWPAVPTLGESNLFRLVSTLRDLVRTSSDAVLLAQNAEQSRSSDKPDTLNLSTVSSTAAVVRYAECAGELIRVLHMAMKPRRNAYAAVEGSSASSWMDVVDDFLRISVNFLSIDTLDKDVITSSTLGTMCLQWIARNNVLSKSAQQFSAISGVHQVRAIIDCVKAKVANTSESGTISLEHVKMCGFHPRLAEVFPKLSVEAMCGLFRAALNIYDDSTLMHAIDIETRQPLAHIRGGKFSVLMFSDIFDAIIDLSVHRLPAIQAIGLQALEAWVSRVEGIERGGQQSIDRAFSHEHAESLAKIICTACKLISRSWNHPSKLINHLVPVVYQRLVDLMALLDTNSSARGYVGGPDYADFWSPLIEEALQQPVHQRCRYQALSILLPRVGGMRFVQNDTSIVRSLTLSMRVRDVSSAASAFMGNLLRSVKPLMLQKDFNALWEKFVVVAICSEEYKLKSNSVDYLIPEVLSVDPLCAPRLIELVRTLKITSRWANEIRLYAIISIVLQCRILGVVGKDIVEDIIHVDSNEVGQAAAGSKSCVTVMLGQIVRSDASDNFDTSKIPKYLALSGPLRSSELIWACLSDNVDVRMSAFTLITTTHQALLPLNQLELDILKATLPYSLKTASADIRHKILRAVRSLVLRLRDTARSASRDLKRLQKKAIATQTAVDAEEGSKYEGTLLVAHETSSWLNSALQSCIYPGASSERQIVALELYQFIYENISSDEADDARLIDHFTSPEVVKGLLNLVISSWDRARKLAAELLQKFPFPLPGFHTPESVTMLLRWGTRLSGSSRQRESDAGALLLRIVFSVYSLGLGWDLNALSESCTCNTQSVVEDKGVKKLKNIEKPLQGIMAVNFVSSVCDLLSIRLRGLEPLFHQLLHQSDAVADGQDTSPLDDVLELEENTQQTATELCHGLMLTLNHIFEVMHKQNLFDAEFDVRDLIIKDSSVKDSSSAWKYCIQRVFSLAQQGFDLALSVIAEAPCDYSLPNSAPNNVNNTSGTSKTLDSGLTKGPVGVNSCMFLNTNSFMEVGTPKAQNVRDAGENTDEVIAKPDDDEQYATMGADVQKAVVGAWLLVKESSSLLSRIIELSVLSSSKEGKFKKNCKHKSGLSLTESDSVNPSRSIWMDNDEIRSTGSKFLDSLCRLKHMGAISETQTSLQTVCSAILRVGDKNPELCALPGLWLETMLKKLQSEEQVFILRRSAGFAYGFVALLRSESSNYKRILLPLAMEKLVEIAKGGLIREGVLSEGFMDENSFQLVPSDVIDESQLPGWRACVHALNIIRLIILDGTLGPHLDSFICRATMCCVRGFESKRWAVRNSSMMVFSAVIQRAVDVEKKESGGSRAATAAEFFQRYPALFPFLLKELASITDFEIESDGARLPVRVTHRGSEKHENDIQTKIHPSLYPILLFLSKMRVLTSADVLPSSDSGFVFFRNCGSERLPKGGFNLHFFTQLVESCGANKLQQVREMSAKALSSLVPLDRTPEYLLDKINLLRRSFEEDKGNPLRINELHGKLLNLQEMLNGLARQMNETAYAMGGNKDVFDKIKSSLSADVVPSYLNLVRGIIGNSMMPDSSLLADPLQTIRTVYISRIQSPNDTSLHRRCPSLLLCLQRSTRVLLELCGDNTKSLEIMAAMSCASLVDVLVPSLRGTVLREFNSFEAFAIVPFTPVMWREALIDLVPLMIHHAYVTACQGFVDKSDLYLTIILDLLDHQISEIRFGVLCGMLLYYEIENDEADISNRRATFCFSMEKLLPSGNDHSMTHLLRNNILLRLMQRCLVETEAAELQTALHLLNWVLKFAVVDEIDAETQDVFIKSIPVLWSLMVGDLSGNKRLRRELSTEAVIARRAAPRGTFSFPRSIIAASDFFLRETAKQLSELHDLNPTIAAANVLEISGWTVGSILSKYVYPSSENGNAKPSRLESHQSELLMLFNWTSFMESYIDDNMPVYARLSVARALKSSGVLKWTMHFAASCMRSRMQQPAPGLAILGDAKLGPETESLLKSSPIYNGELASRLWLIVLKLMQDDDEVVRREMNMSALSATVKFQDAIRTTPIENLFRSRSNIVSMIDMALAAAQVSCKSDFRINRADAVISNVVLPVQSRSLQELSVPIGACLIWSLIIDESPSKLEAPTASERIVAYATRDAAADSSHFTDEFEKAVTMKYGDRSAVKNLSFCAHRGVKHVLEHFMRLGGSTKLLSEILALSQKESASQRIFEPDQANLHYESVAASNVLIGAFLIAIKGVAPALSNGITVMILTHMVDAITVLDVAFKRLAWLGGPSFQQDLFAFALTSLVAGKEVLETLNEASALLGPRAGISVEVARISSLVKTRAIDILAQTDEIEPLKAASRNRSPPLPLPVPAVEPSSSSDDGAGSIYLTWLAVSRVFTSLGLAEPINPNEIDESDSAGASQKEVAAARAEREAAERAISESSHMRAPIMLQNRAAQPPLHPVLAHLLFEVIANPLCELRDRE